MCGLSAVFAYHYASPEVKRDELQRITDHLRARGPDGEGAWYSDDNRFACGHRRLSIIDLDARAAQPMVSANAKFVLSYNGEIYNHRELRRELEQLGVQFKTQSDTEVLLELFAREGVAMLNRLRGMFALAIWDKTNHELTLARDPYGIKPLYYADDGWTLRVASQVKALLAGGAVSRVREPAGEAGFLLWGSVPEPFTLYQDIRSLPAGTWMRVDALGPHTPTEYASIASVWNHADVDSLASTELDAAIRDAVRSSVAAHLIADVPVGVFLSSGLDSAAVLAHASACAQEPVTAITLGFSEFENKPEDEVPHARALAARFGARHVVRRVDAQEFERDLDAIDQAMDQPSIDGINTWFVAKAAREQGLKVALSGIGGDELLGGYPSFRQLPQWRAWLFLPSHLPLLGRLFRTLSTPLLLRQRRASSKLAGMIEYGKDWPGLYMLKRGLFLPHELPALMGKEAAQLGLSRLAWNASIQRRVPLSGSAWNIVAALESQLYLRNQLLRDTDWAGMAHSIEIRTPLVDWTLLQSVAPLLNTKHQHHFKAAMLPDALLQDRAWLSRPKTGFVLPYAQWKKTGNSDRPRHAAPAARMLGDWSRFRATELIQGAA